MHTRSIISCTVSPQISVAACNGPCWESQVHTELPQHAPSIYRSMCQFISIPAASLQESTHQMPTASYGLYNPPGRSGYLQLITVNNSLFISEDSLICSANHCLSRMVLEEMIMQPSHWSIGQFLLLRYWILQIIPDIGAASREWHSFE